MSAPDDRTPDTGTGTDTDTGTGTGTAPGPAAGEQLARRLVQDVAAFEVDPPAPGRADPDAS